jgi:hypothetical protein
MGDPTSSYATAGIALKVSGALKPHHHDKAEAPSVGFSGTYMSLFIRVLLEFYVDVKATMFKSRQKRTSLKDDPKWRGHTEWCKHTMEETRHF